MSDRLIYPRVIKLATSTPDLVGAEFHELYEWIVSKLTSDPTRVIAHEHSICVNSDELIDNDRPASRRLVESGTQTAGGPSTLIIELSTNPYDLLRDPIACDVAEFAMEWIRDHPERSCVILLPALPPRDASIFWKPLLSERQQSSIVVLGNDGSAWPDHISREVGQSYVERRSKLAGEPTAETHILKELGHFPITDGTTDYCARYFFDASLAVKELGRELADEISEHGPSQQSLVLLTHGNNSPWLHETALLAGGILPMNAPAVDITRTTDLGRLTPTGTAPVLVLDVVNTGQTCARIVGELLAQGVQLSPTIFAAMIDHHCPSVPLPDGFAIRGLHEVVADKQTRSECVQCSLGLPFTEPLSQQGSCRPFDFWHALLSEPWKPETYGPDGLTLFAEGPDMGAVFDDFGGWIAHKVGIILDEVLGDRDIVFVCPEELHINKLMPHLSPRFHGKVVAVRVPRPVLNGVSASASGIGWAKQLEHVAHAQRRVVVIIDEFNGSNTTAGAIVQLLRSYGIIPDLYLPILNRVHDAAKTLGIPVRTLYEIPSPRR